MKILILIISFSQLTLLYSQNKNSENRYSTVNWSTFDLDTEKKPLWSKSIIPLTLGITALSINCLPIKQDIHNSIRTPFNGYTTSIDDYIQYIPIGLMYTADVFKLKTEHSIWNQTKLLFLSELSVGAVIQILKHSLKVERPDQSSNNSFPSGHTGQTFVAAQVLRNEFKNTQPLLAYSGYLFATSTGVLRVVNNKHWLPDVLMSAGIGILMTNIIYHYEPFKNWNPFKKKKSDLSLKVYPTFNDQYTGVNIKLHL